MGNLAPFALVAVLLAIVVLVAIWSYRQEQKLVAEMAAWAQADGWSFRREKRRDPAHPFALFRRGHSRHSRYHASRSASEVIPGWEEELDMELFQYHYAETHGSGKNRRTSHYHRLCVLVDTGIELGEITIRPEHLGDKIAGLFGADDIDFEDPEFSKRFHVSAREAREAYDFIDGAMMRFLCGTGGWTIATNGPLLLAYSSERVSPHNYAGHAAFARDVLMQLPRTLINAGRAHRGLSPLIEAGNAAAEARARRGDHEGP